MSEVEEEERLDVATPGDVAGELALCQVSNINSWPYRREYITHLGRVGEQDEGEDRVRPSRREVGHGRQTKECCASLEGY